MDKQIQADNQKVVVYSGQEFKNKSGYSNLHAKLKELFGKASKCEHDKCRKKPTSRYEWALIKGRQYSLNREDYMQMCVPCHREYDVTEEVRSNRSKRYKGILFHNRSRPVIQYDMNMKFICEFPSVQEASRKTKANRTGIIKHLAGGATHSGGFIWKYKTPKNEICAYDKMQEFARQQSISFAIWINEHQYYKHLELWYQSENDNFTPKTDDQLYALFIENQNIKP